MGSIPSQATKVKDPPLLQLQLRSLLQLGSDSWPRGSMWLRVAKNGGKKNTGKVLQEFPLWFSDNEPNEYP